LNIILKLSLVFLTTSLAWTQTTAVPDANFEQKLIDLGHDDVIDGLVVTETVAALTSLDLSNALISDVTGLEAFTSLVNLNLSDNTINQIEFLTNIALTELDLSNNGLFFANVSANTALTKLHLKSNQLTTLDVNANTALTELHLDMNQLASVDLSANAALVQLGLSHNMLSELDLSANIALSHLSTFGNPELTCIYVGENSIETTDFDEFQFLSDLACNDIAITLIPDPMFEEILIGLELDETLDGSVLTSNIETLIDLSFINSDVSDLTGIEDFRDLQNLTLDGTNLLTFVDISHNHELVIVNAHDTHIENVVFSTIAPYVELLFDGSPIKQFDFTGFSFSSEAQPPMLTCVVYDEESNIVGGMLECILVDTKDIGFVDGLVEGAFWIVPETARVTDDCYLAADPILSDLGELVMD